MNQTEVRRLFNYNPETGILTNRIGGHGKKVGKEAGNLSSNGYRVVCIYGKKYKVARIIWFYFYGQWPTAEIDHDDRIRDNNRISNLFDRTSSENSHNRKKYSNNISGINGVRWNNQRNKWNAYIGYGPKRHIGTFDSIEEATAARKEVEIELGYHPNHGRVANEA